jgi:hypothetical protein
MDILEDKSNSDLVMERESLKNEYEALKNRMLKECDKLDELAARYGKVNRILKERNV